MRSESRAADGLALRTSRDLTESTGGTLEPATDGTGFAVMLTLAAAARKRGPLTGERAWAVIPSRRP
ncbi:hypothetical protein GCM10010347_31890 [Streptomyces cirratus]|uniref:Uncharacterized protein n=1 Tax=Streptomyces cirratus TaxID=68187 RepID=A0ABQ3EXL2_9ACTN|nr:hypothetical protein GCM10010347_31890 [Streptomyces cirratus]